MDSSTETGSDERRPGSALSLRRQVALATFVFVMALIPRLWSPSPFITWDEPTWTYRALQFARGLQTGDLAATHQSNHPGVPTMWAGASAMALRAVSDGRLRLGDLSVAGWPEYDEDDTQLLAALAPWWPWARASIAALTAALITISFLLQLRLLDLRAALVAAALVSFSPYFLAHSRILQLDAVLAASMIGSVVSLTVILRTGMNRYAAFSGVLAAVAALEKSPAIFLVPFTALLLASQGILAWRVSGFGSASRRFVTTISVWLVAMLTTYVLLWPAMWVAPLSTVGAMLGYATDAASGAREAVYFWGAVQPDPGVLFYLGALPFRLTPLVLLGLLAVLGLWRRHDLRERTLVVVMLTFVVLFLLFMGDNAKKFERYLLPVVPALGIVAAVGLVHVTDLGSRIVGAWFAGRSRPCTDPMLRRAANIALCVALAAQIAAVLAHGPYYLAWYNPLAGGGAAAAERLPVGWGEGMDQVAEYLNWRGVADDVQLTFMAGLLGRSAVLAELERHDDLRARTLDLTVSTPSVTLLAPLFYGTTVKARDWEQADYVVLYLDDVQIGEPDLVGRFHGVVEPEHVVTINGIDYAWIYRVSDPSQ